MSQARDPSATPSTAGLSAEARALLAELNRPEGTAPPAEAPAPQAAPPQKPMQNPVQNPVPRKPGGTPILLRPHVDGHAAAFADLLDHIDDADGTPAADDKAAQAAALKYRAQQRSEPSTGSSVGPSVGLSGDPSDAMAGDMAASPTAPQAGAEAADGPSIAAGSFGGPDDMPDASAAADMPTDAAPGDANAGMIELDDALFGEEEKPKGFAGLFARFGASGGVARLVGFKNASAAYDTQSGRSLLPFTINRAVVLVLVAAVPPLVNLIVIQPQISDNQRKLTQIRTYKAKSQEDAKEADKLAKKIARAKNAAKATIANLKPDDEIQTLVTQYLEALQRYDVELTGYNVTTDPERKVIAGDKVQVATILQVDMISRYSVYTEIRRIFVEQAKSVKVLDEVFEVQPDSLDLNISARFMMPTYRAYDSELDVPKADDKEKKEEGK